MSIRRITDDLLYVGVSERRLALFENVYPIPAGVSYNSYLLLDQQTVLQGGFLGLFQKSCIKVSFVVKDRGHSEQEDFSTAKESIIKNSKVDYSKLVVKQYNELTGMMAQMNSQIEDLKIKGRHDVCFALRTPVIIESIAAIALIDLYMQTL